MLEGHVPLLKPNHSFYLYFLNTAVINHKEYERATSAELVETLDVAVKSTTSRKTSINMQLFITEQ